MPAAMPADMPAAMPADTVLTPSSFTFSNDLRLGLTADLVDRGSYDRAVERFRERSVYNQQCDDEWNVPIGYAASCGGDA